MSSLHQHVRIFLSLGAVFFLAPYVRYFVRRTSLPLSVQDINFILSYTKLGWLNICLLLTVFVAGGVSYVMQYDWLWILYHILVIVLIISLICGAFFVCANTQLTQWNSNSKLWQVNHALNHNDQREVLLSFLPIYNVYLWYHIHQFASPPLILKESLVRTGSFALLTFFSPPGRLVLLFVLAYVSRVVLAVAGIRIEITQPLPRPYRWYVVNIEESRAYILGYLHALYITWKQKTNNPEKIFADYIQAYQERYRMLGSFAHNHQLVREYIVLCILLVIYIQDLLTASYYGFRMGVQWLGIVLVISRYLVMLPYKQFPRVPLIAECLDGIAWFGRKIRTMFVQ